MRAAVLGSGSFGTALANTLAVNCAQVRVWGRDAAAVSAINTRHENPGYLPGIPLSERVRATGELSEALDGAELVVLAIPSQATREVMKRTLPWIPQQVPIVCVSKGIENGSLMTMSQLLEDCLPEAVHPYLAILSGPSFAKELALRMPTVVTIASRWDKVAQRVQKTLQTESFRAYTSSDVVGVELGKGRALKDVLGEMNQVAEGVKTAKSARDLSEKTGVELPICAQVYAIMYEGKEPKRAVVELMTRTPKAES